MALFFVDFGTDTDTDAQSPSGAGTSGDPFNAKAFSDKVKSVGGTGDAGDLYLAKGSMNHTWVNGLLFLTKLSPWSLSSFGPWQMRFKNSGGSPPQAIMEGGVMDFDNSLFTANMTGRNMQYIGATFKMRNASSLTFDFKGCTIQNNINIQIAALKTVNLVNSVMQGTFLSADTPTVIVNSTNSVFKQSKAAIEALSNVWTVNDIGTSSEFGVTFLDTPPIYGDTLNTKFLPDSAITIDGSGDYTDHACGLFGNPRVTAASPAKGIGASYFPPVPMVGKQLRSNQGINLGLGLGF